MPVWFFGDMIDRQLRALFGKVELFGCVATVESLEKSPERNGRKLCILVPTSTFVFLPPTGLIKGVQGVEIPRLLGSTFGQSKINQRRSGCTHHNKKYVDAIGPLE